MTDDASVRGRPPVAAPRSVRSSTPVDRPGLDDRTDPGTALNQSSPPALAPPPGGVVRSPPPPTLDAHRRARPNPSRSEPIPARSDGATHFDGAVVERSRPVHSSRLEVESPPANVRRILMAVLAALLMAAYFAGWMMLFSDTLSVWWTD